MGRSAVRGVVEAVALPHDGPLDWLLLQQQGNENPHTVVLEAQTGVMEARDVLLQLVQDDESACSSRRLCQKLLSATEIRTQLQALQAYRSTLLHQQRLLNEESNVQGDNNGLYRVLLEWSFSAKTPTALKRAIQSSLDAISCTAAVTQDVVSSLFVHDTRWWTNPVMSLFEALSYGPAQRLILSNNRIQALRLLVRISKNDLQPILKQHSFLLSRRENNTVPQMFGQDVLEAVEQSLQVASTLKLILTPLLSSRHEKSLKDYSYQAEEKEFVAELESFLWCVLSCRATHGDGLSATGVTHGQTLLFQWITTISGSSVMEQDIARRATDLIDTALHNKNGLPDLNVLAIVQGIAATLPNHVLLCGSPTATTPILFDPLASFLLQQCRHATDAAVRLSSLRALDTLLSKCRAILRDNPQKPFDVCSHVESLAQETTEIVLQTWENPPGRRVESAIPSLFQSLIRLLQTLSPVENDGKSSLEPLVRRVLSQPPNRKGRYLSLETLVPVVGAKTLLEMGDNDDDLIESLVAGIGDRGHNAGAIADLLGKLLCQLREELNADAGIVVDAEKVMNKKQRRKLKNQAKRGENVLNAPEMSESQLLPAWIARWAPHFACALLDPSAIRRKQVAAFCIPLLVNIVGGQTRRSESSHAFVALFDELQRQFDRLRCNTCDSYVSNNESLVDRFVWAKLKIARQASLQKVLTMSTLRLRKELSKHLPVRVVKSALTHSVASIRLVAFSALEAVVPTFESYGTPLEIIIAEMKLWRYALPYAFKSGEKEYVTKLLQCLTSLLNRASFFEADALEASQVQSVKLDALTISDEMRSLPQLSSFVCDFLVSDLILRQGAYPGTVAEKEGFALSLLQTILSFTISEEGLSTDNKPRAKSNTAPTRRLSSCQEEANLDITRRLISGELFATLLLLLHSMWDNTRSAAYTCMCNLVGQAHKQKLPLPMEISSDVSRSCIESRALFLASSPRQREADTGARMLAFLYTTFSQEEDRSKFLRKLVETSSERVSAMEKGLGLLLLPQENVDVRDGRSLPLAHGLVQALRLTVESVEVFPAVDNKSRDGEDAVQVLFGKIADVCFRSIQVSLAVVADVKDGGSVEGLDTDIGQNLKSNSANQDSGQAPLNVNTGAIGANASFSSVKTPDGEETVRRFAIQRVVMGSWLLAKEACAALASVVTAKQFHASRSLVERAGTLMISTLTTLKHQGAAFASHKVLQQIAETCSKSSYSDPGIASLPSEFANRLLREISATEIVRDSTLRRSTGYALGFLSIMRSEPPSRVAPRTLSPYILANLMRLSLPSEGAMLLFMERFRFNTTEEQTMPFIFPSVLNTTSTNPYISDENYEWRCRVHALNILRLAILDAPLASDVSKFIGDAVMTAILGYNDPAWAVRNSSTMVFAAAMLRVVDADKNANQKDLTSGNAITATELFRTYPVLSPFLQSVMEEGIQDMRMSFGLPVPSGTEQASRLIHPPLYPMLLLLSRVQAVRLSGHEAAEVVGPFVPFILGSLGHSHHKIRIVAARALANICSGEYNRESSTFNLLMRCGKMLTDAEQSEGCNWKAKHGALLGIQSLLKSSNNAGVLLSKAELLPYLLQYASWSQGSCECPPPCTAVALETLSNVANGGVLLEQAVTASNTVLFRIEQISARTSLTNLVGMARLGSVAARVACNHSMKAVWDPNADDSSMSVSFEMLLRLFQSNVLDVRMEAVKAFKKKIYGSIDNLLSTENMDTRKKVNILVQMSRTLFTALSVETLRRTHDQGEKGFTETHPPTVRRLSRCLLECMYAYRSLILLEAEDCDFNDMTDMREVNNVCCRVLNIKESSTMEVAPHLVEGNSACGAALELMAFAIHTCANSKTQKQPDVKMLGLFVSTITQLNTPHSSWRLRHSVALAIETSQLLDLSPGSVSEETDRRLQSLRLDLFVTLLSLLQDSDCDVRSVAGRCITKALRQTGKLVSNDSLNSVPLLVMEQMGEEAQRQFPTGELTKRLLESTLNATSDLKENTALFLGEISHSENATSSFGLLNVNTSRKIFEDEDPNPFEERLLGNQLAAWIMIQSTEQVDPSSGSVLTELMSRCYDTLALIQQRSLGSKHADIIHEFTRSNRIFPAVHSFLISCIAAIYVGGCDSRGVQNAARLIVESKESTLSIHPCITEALQVLVAAKSRNDATRQGLIKCCFLLPECVRP